VKARSVIFFAAEDQIPDVRRLINEEVLPRFSEVPEFLGFVALQSEASRPEVIAMSFWNDGLEGSEAISEELRDEIERVTGAALARKEFTIITMTMRGSNGEICLDLPMSDGGEERCPRGHRLVDGPLPVGGQPTLVKFCPTCNARFSKDPDGRLTQVPGRPRP
jgi:hypothetical protein